jgi:hypothetical protein
LTVQGTTTTINSNTITTNDLQINMANNAANATAANNGGIEVGPVGAPYATLLYNTASNVWVASLGISSVGNLSTGANVIATGNISGGNINSGNIYAADINLTGNVYGNNGNLILYANAAQPELGWLISNDNLAYAGPNNSALVTPLSDDIHIGEILFQATTGTAIATFAGPNNAAFSNAFNIISTANILFTTQDVANSSGNIMCYDLTGNLTIPNNILSYTSVTPPVPLANLTAVGGGRAFIDDGNLVASGNFGSEVSDGGSNVVPVWSDGVNWYIG